MRQNINHELKNASSVEFVGAEGNIKKVSSRTLSAILHEIGGFPMTSNGKWQYPPRLVSKTVCGYEMVYEYISALYTFNIIIVLK